jgi:hypothetical protein
MIEVYLAILYTLIGFFAMKDLNGIFLGGLPLLVFGVLGYTLQGITILIIITFLLIKSNYRPLPEKQEEEYNEKRNP